MPSITRKRASGLPLLVIVLASLALAATGCGDDSIADRGVRMYCTYGAMSTAQRDGCIAHTTADQVRSRSTPAARFANSALKRPEGWAERCVRDGDYSAECAYCAEDAGPLCFDREKENLDTECDKASDNDPSFFRGATECDQAYADLSSRRGTAGFGPQVR